MAVRLAGPERAFVTRVPGLLGAAGAAAVATALLGAAPAYALPQPVQPTAATVLPQPAGPPVNAAVPQPAAQPAPAAQPQPAEPPAPATPAEPAPAAEPPAPVEPPEPAEPAEPAPASGGTPLIGDITVFNDEIIEPVSFPVTACGGLVPVLSTSSGTCPGASRVSDDDA